jgi:hypothetical protein
MLVELSWGVLSALHVAPALVLVRPSLISRLYNVPAGSDTELLLRHRGALFSIIAGLCGGSVMRPSMRPVAAPCVALAMGSFLALFVAGGAPSKLRSIAIADAACLPFLAVALYDALKF